MSTCLGTLHKNVLATVRGKMFPQKNGVKLNSQFQPDEIIGFLWLHVLVIFTQL